MNKNVWNGIALLLAAIAVLALVGCSQEAEELSSDVNVTKVTVAGKTVILGTPSSSWMEAKEEGKAGAVFLSSAQLKNAEVVVQKGQGGQTVYLAAAKPSVMPEFVETTQFDFDVFDYLWVEVFSENHDGYNIYAIQIKTSTPTVSDLTLAGRSAVGGTLPNGRPIQQYGKGLGNHNANLAQAAEGEIWFGNNEAGTALAVVATSEDPDTTVLIATGTAGGTADTLFPSGYSNPETITATNGNYLYIKSISADAVNGETIYYKVKLVEKNADFVIDGVTIQGNTQTAVSFTVGTAGSNGFGGGENRANAANLAANNAGYKNILSTVAATQATATVNIGTKPTGAIIRYGHTDWDAAQEDVPSTGHTTLVYQTSNVLQNIPTNEFIAVEVTNELGDKRWYSFRVRVGNPSTELTSLSVATDENVTVPGANALVTGNTVTEHRMSSAGVWNLAINAGIPSGATKAFAIADAINQNVTNWDNTSGTFTAVKTAQYVFVRIIPEDLGPASYYKAQLLYGSDDADVSSVTVSSQSGLSAGGAGIVNVGSPQSTDKKGNVVEAVVPSFTADNGGSPGTVTLTRNEAEAGFNVEATVSPAATVRCGYIQDTVGAATTRAIQWSTTVPVSIPAISDTTVLGSDPDQGGGPFIIIEVTSESGLVKQYVIIVTISG